MKAGTKDVFVDKLPGYPDGLRRGPDGSFWIAIVVARQPTLELLLYSRSVSQQLMTSSTCGSKSWLWQYFASVSRGRLEFIRWAYNALAQLGSSLSQARLLRSPYAMFSTPHSRVEACTLEAVRLRRSFHRLTRWLLPRVPPSLKPLKPGSAVIQVRHASSQQHICMHDVLPITTFGQTIPLPPTPSWHRSPVDRSTIQQSHEETGEAQSAG